MIDRKIDAFLNDFFQERQESFARDTNKLQDVLAVQKSILQEYKRDIMKYKRGDSSQKLYIDEVFQLIPSEFDNIKSKQKNERNIIIAIITITILVLIATVSILFLRYKQYKTKAEMAHDQMMIKNYESQIKELERMDQHKEKKIETINKRKEKLLDKHRDTLNRGYILFNEILNGKTTVLWKKNDFNIIEYYRLVDMEFVDMLDNSYDELSPKYKFFLILEHIGRTDKQIMAAMGIAEVSGRSIRSRVNKKKKEF